MSNATLVSSSPPATANMGWLDRLTRRAVIARLGAMAVGQLTLRHGDLEQRLGTDGPLQASLDIHDSRFFRRAALGGSLGFAESYIQGEWDSDDLTALLRMLAGGSGGAHGGGLLSSVIGLWRRLQHARRSNTRRGSRRNIAAHYDLGNDFYRLWLDETLAYSSGIFPRAGTSLSEASKEKFDRVCRKLDLRPSDHVVEIGSGWGGFALHAAEHYGCRVTTTTISRQQFELAEQRVTESGVGERIAVLNVDYRDLVGQFDKLVSIEMIEAVGHRYLGQFLGQCSRLLKPDGSLVLQAIVMPEHGYRRYLRSVDFIQRYVFPGGCLPSVEAILSAAGRTTDLRLVHVEDFAPHYAETLRQWRKSFDERLPDIRRLGYSEELIRLWTYYLCYCEAAFEERCVGVVQIQFDKPTCRRDPLRIGQAASGTTEE